VNAEWQQTRLISYMIACTVTEADKRENIFDFLPLKGDPTPEERMNKQKRLHERLIADQKAFNESLRQELAANKK
jgi:hypothetical protein